MRSSLLKTPAMKNECNICARGCQILEGRLGACRNYMNDHGQIREINPHRYLLVEPIAIESVPMLNFYPRTKFLQITTTGCVFNCSGCVSGVLVQEMNTAGNALVEMTPGQVVNKARNSDCAGIVFLMNDPLASLHTFAQVAQEAQKNGLLVGFSSNGYFTEASLESIIDYVDFANIGLKGLNDEAYRACGVSGYKPVYRTLRTLHQRGVHVEVSCIFKTSNREDILAVAREVASIDRAIPFQIMRFVPYEEAPGRLEPTIRQAEELAREISGFVDYAYLFNSPGTNRQDTLCPRCGFELIKREYWGPMGAIVRSTALPDEGPMLCPGCGTPLPIRGRFNNCDCDTSDGGYAFSRALEIMEGILITLGVDDHSKVVQLWEKTLSERSSHSLHLDIQRTDTYLERIRDCGIQVGEQERAERLIAYYRSRLDEVTARLVGVQKRPRVYYCMGKPLFATKAERFQHHIVELAGGLSVNKDMSDITGRPGMGIPARRLNEIDPDVIFVSAHYKGAIDDFYLDCQEAGVDVKALRSGRIFNHASFGWEYGSPRWLLGFLHMANCLHPELFSYDMEKEAGDFYRRFYGIEFDASEMNNSFGKPSCKWTWAGV